MVVSDTDVIFIDLIISGIYLTLYIYRPKLSYAIVGVFAMAIASIQFHLYMNGSSLSKVLAHLF